MKSKSIITALSSLVFALAGTAASAQNTNSEWVSLSAESGEIVINAPGFASSKAVSSAFFTADGKNHAVRSKGGKLIGKVQTSTADTPFGEAVVTRATYGQDGSPYQYTLTLKRLKNLRAFTLQGVFHNYSDKDANLNHIDLLDQSPGDIKTLATGDAAEWLVTPLMQDTDALSLAETNGGFNEVVLIAHKDGRSVLVGPVGPAEAHCRVEVKNQKLKAYAQMDRVLVRAGESRRSEEMIVCFEPTATATDVWTRWVAATHKARIHRGPVYGWCSWYDLTTKITAEHVLNVTKTIKDNPHVFGKGIIQIDDGYQKMDGDWSANKKFPMGMAAVAKEIRDAGCIPGVWFAPLMINPDHPWIEKHPDAIQTNAKGIASFMNANPFHPAGAKWVNPDHPATKVYLHKIISDARERGYGYIKIDFNGIGSRFVDPTKTRLQVFRDLYTLYRDAAGEEIYILSCLGQPTRGVIGFIDAARVGPDSHPAHFSKCLKSVLRFQIYDNVWWQNDPDVAYVSAKGTKVDGKPRSLGGTPEGEGMWRTWHNAVALVGGTSMVSDPLDAPGVDAMWRNYEILRPSHTEDTRLLTLGETADNSIFGFTAERPFGNFAVYNLYNAKEGERHINLNFAKAGLPLNGQCAVYDFWQDKVIAYTEGSYNTVPLEKNSSAMVRITPLSESGPTLVGSNLHLAMGTTEVGDIRVTPSKMTIELNPAGAQQGTLTIHSDKPLTAGAAENCTIDKVESAGENLYKVHLSGRPWDTTQSITLNISQ
ncbi:MAG: glycoside hydrolase family 36 protein [Akkermansiaceae bacterium]